MKKQLDVVSFYKEVQNTIVSTEKLHGISRPKGSEVQHGGGCGKYGVYLYELKRFDDKGTFWLPYWEYELLSSIENVFPTGTMEKPSCQVFIVGTMRYDLKENDIIYYTTPYWIEKHISDFQIFEGKIIISKLHEMVNAKRWGNFLETMGNLRNRLLGEVDTAYEYFPFDMGNPKYFLTGEIVCKQCEIVLLNSKQAKEHNRKTGHKIH
ncbi:MAG: hypothetical protein KGI28_01335 [Thaumarchaeota archaeon]|nr:hypothetical protein [Nitrososphaerota archaeon]